MKDLCYVMHKHSIMVWRLSIREIDMYGSVRKAGMTERRGLAFGVPIPFETVRDETRMELFRRYFVFNRDMPGAMENVHPNKFIASKADLLIRSSSS